MVLSFCWNIYNFQLDKNNLLQFRGSMTLLLCNNMKGYVCQEYFFSTW